MPSSAATPSKRGPVKGSTDAATTPTPNPTRLGGMKNASLTYESAIGWLLEAGCWPLLLHALAAPQRLRRLGRGRRRLHAHLLLELLEHLLRADLLRILFDLHALRVDVGHGHVHAR